MGKCLSKCCKESDDDDVGDSKNGSETDGGKAEVSSPTDKIGRSSGNASGSAVDSSNSERFLRNNGNGKSTGVGGAPGAVTSGATGAPASGNNAGNNEKQRMFSRIPPILTGGVGGLSVGGGNDGKKSGQNSKDSVSESKIVTLYEQYKDPAEDAILSDGIERFCQDLEVKPEEFKVLVLAWKFGAETMCRFSKSEFVNGCKSMKVSSVRGIQTKFPDLLQEVQDGEKFKDLYRFTFKFGLDSETGQRLLPTDMAISLWKLVFSQKEPPLLHRWLKFLEKHPNVRGIPRDTWNMFLNFLEAVGDDLVAYDDSEAWPSLFDDFVEYENDQTNQNVQKEVRVDDDL